MKRYLLFALPLIALFSCVDSELIVPGENIGDGDIPTDNPIDPIGSDLQQYEMDLPDFMNIKFNFNQQGDLTNSVVGLEIPLIGSITSTVNFTYTDNLVSSIDYSNGSGFYSDVYTVTYDNDNRIQEISAGTSPTTNLIFNYTTDSIVATRTVDGTEDATISFNRNGQNFFTDYSISFTSGETYTYTSTFSGNNIVLEKYSRNNTEFSNYTFEYDTNTNPIYGQVTNNFRDLAVVVDAFDTESSDPSVATGELIISQSPSISSTNNLTKLINNDNNSTDSFLDFEYTYTDDNLPINASITNADGNEGTAVYTYY